MSHDLIAHATALIEHIQTRFHDGHRRALPELLALAAEVEANGVASGLVDALSGFATELDRHMFKEEMRLFPMMAQGGNTLIGQLIDNLHREHAAHEDAAEDLRDLLQGLARARGADTALRALTQAFEAFVSEFGAHVRAEDTELFPLFVVPAHAATGHR